MNQMNGLRDVPVYVGSELALTCPAFHTLTLRGFTVTGLAITEQGAVTTEPWEEAERRDFVLAWARWHRFRWLPRWRWLRRCLGLQLSEPSCTSVCIGESRFTGVQNATAISIGGNNSPALRAD